jgi:hypothetical protein
MIDISLLEKDGVVWNIASDECPTCGRDRWNVYVIVNAETKLTIASCYSQEDAIAFIQSCKKAGISR